MKYLLSVPWPFLQGKMCVQGVWKDSFSSFLIYMLLCFHFRDGKVKEILLPLHKCVFEASGNSGGREPNRACKRNPRMWVFPSPIHCVFFVQAFGIISLKKNKTKIFARDLFSILSLLLSFHLELSQLLPRCSHLTRSLPAPCSCSPEAAARWERGTTPSPTAQSPSWVQSHTRKKDWKFFSWMNLT